MAKKPRKQAYVVFKGKIPGIYSGWEECFAQINGFRGQEQKVYESLEAAERAWEEYQSSIVQANPAPSAWPEKCLGIFPSGSSFSRALYCTDQFRRTSRSKED